MPSLNELSPRSQLVVFALLALALVGGAEYAWLNTYRDQNAASQAQLQQLVDDNNKLRPFEKRAELLRAENVTLERQLETLQAIMPEQRATDDFILQIDQAARDSNVGLRRITARPQVTKELFVEAPYEVVLDGSFNNLLDFFGRLAHLERIVNASDLNLSGIDGGGGDGYRFRSDETVKATCTVTTFFSHVGVSSTKGKPVVAK